MAIAKDKKVFEYFEKNYWQYFLELEEQFISTRKYVAFDKANFKTFSTEYLKLIEAVCSEIDIVGKEIAHQIDSSFKPADSRNNIQKWWYVIQDWFAQDVLSPIEMYEMKFNPWNNYRIEQFSDSKGAKRYRLEGSSNTPLWWTSYNKVKHNRTLDDPATQEKNFQKANLGNLCEAFSALFLLEKRFMMSVGIAEDYNRVQLSQLFEKRKPEFFVDEDGCWCQADD